MADVPGKFYRATKVRTGVSPSSAGSIEGEPLPPVNPPGSSLNSVGLTMPSAFTVSNSPLTANGTIGVAGAGTVAQYIRGDGSLADFPESSGGGGSVNYYLNGSVNQGTIGGVAYKEINKVPILGAGTQFSISADGYIASFITDAGDPNLLEIPGGNWNFETYFSSSSSGGTPTFYVELYKYDGTTFTLIASSVTSPEFIAFGTTLTPYFSTLAVPTTTLALTDRLAVRYYVTHSGRTITLHTENNTLCQIITTFTTGLTALNGLTAQVQNFAVGTTGTDFNIASAVSTHTFNLPTASATNRGALSSADWALFTQAYNDKINSAAVTGTTTKTLTLTQQDGGTITASWSDLNTDAVLSVFGRTGAVVAVSGDYTTAQVTESGNLYYTEARVNANANVAANTAARHNAVTLGTANGLSLSTQVLSLGLASAGVTGALSGTDWSTFNGKQNALTLTTTGTSGAATLVGATLNIPQYQAALTNPVTGTGTAGQVAFWNGSTSQTGDNGLFWDNTNKRLGVGTVTPIARLNTYQVNGGGEAQTIFQNFSTTTDTTVALYLSPTNGTLTTGSIRSAFIKAINVGGGVTALTFGTNSSGADPLERWRITSTGIFQSNGAQTIQTSTGNLTLATAAGNGNIVLSPNGTGSVRVVSNVISLNADNASPNVRLGRFNFVRSIYDPNGVAASIDFWRGSGGIEGLLAFSTNPGTSGDNSVERLRITSVGNVLINTTTDAGFRLDVNGTTRLNGLSTIQGTTASDTAPLGSELATTGTGTNWTGSDFATGYTHVVGSTASLTTSLAAVVGTYYQITYTVTGRTAGSFTINYGGTSTAGTTGTVNTGPVATTTATLEIVPSSTFDGTIVLSVRTISNSSATTSFTTSTGTVVNEIRANNNGSNTFVGLNTGRRNTTGAANTFLGMNSGVNNTTGSSNTFVGRGAGFTNSIGSNNSFFGLSSGIANTTGSSNSFFGSEAGFTNTTGSSNSFFGVNSGRGNTTGGSNSFFGVSSGAANTTGGSNSFVGASAGSSNTTGNNNSFVGASAGSSNTTGTSNSYFGINAGLNNTTGGLNSFFGVNAGRFLADGTTSLTIANDSVFIGAGTRANANNETNQIVIGHTAIGGGSNTVVIGNSSIVSNRFFGTMRIGTINNGVGDFITTDVNGVLTRRTAAQTLTDIGAQGALTLTTTGTSGAATLIGATLNIPQYQAALTNPVTGTGVSGRVAFWNGTNSITSDADLLFNGSELNVSGIKIDGSSVPYIISTLAGNDLNIQFPVGQGLAINNNGAENIARIIKNNLTLTGASTIQTSTGNLTIATGGGNGNIILSPNGSGNVGIGTPSPAQKLVVNQTANDTSSVGFYTNANTSQSYGPIILAGTNSSDATFRAFNQAGTSSYFHIRGDGNVGIGTPSPTAYSGFTTLTINGQSGSSGGVLRLTAFDNSSSFNIYAAGNAANFNTTSAIPFVFLTQDTPRMTITSGGNVLIGTTTDNGSKLRVNGSLALPHVTKSANYTLDATDYTVGFDCASNRTATLPDATTCAGRIYALYQYNANATTRILTVQPSASQTINGFSNFTFYGYCDYSLITVQSTGSNWIILGGYFDANCT